MDNQEPQPPVDQPDLPVVVPHIYFEDDEVLQPTTVAKQLIDHGSLVLVGRTITLLDLELVRSYLETAGYGTHSAMSVGPNGPQFYIICYERARATDVEEGESASDLDIERRAAMFDRMFSELTTMGDFSLSSSIGLLSAALRADEGYRMSWLANLAMCFKDEGMEHHAAQRGAARFLNHLAKADATKDKHFDGHPPETSAEESSAESVEREDQQAA